MTLLRLGERNLMLTLGPYRILEKTGPNSEMRMLHRLFLFALTITLLLPTAALAHDNHKLMGTVTMVAADHVMMKTTDGKDLTIGINAKTKILRGKTTVKISDVKEGTRIVATVSTHKAPFTASEIAVGNVTESASKK